MASAQSMFAAATQAAQQRQVLSALRLVDEAIRIDPTITGLHAFRAQCLAAIGSLDEAKISVDEELRRDPSADALNKMRSMIEAGIQKQRELSRLPRKWESCIPQHLLLSIEGAVYRYAHRGHSMIKNPFDIALYPMLLWNLKPRTIFEIGSYNGASALWMADTLSSFGVETHIHSVDVVKVQAIVDPRITFYGGSGRQLDEVFPAEMIANAPRPLLVVEDADHTRETSLAVMNHFHPHMREGEYMIVEDGFTAPGVRDALSEFLAAHSDTWTVDTLYCDFFGYNATWCMNGFLKRVAA